MIDEFLRAVGPPGFQESQCLNYFRVCQIRVSRERLSAVVDCILPPLVCGGKCGGVREHGRVVGSQRERSLEARPRIPRAANGIVVARNLRKIDGGIVIVGATESFVERAHRKAEAVEKQKALI